MTTHPKNAKNRSRRAREGAGLSLGQAARRLGLAREDLARIEDDDGAFAAADHVLIADVYGVNVDWLRGHGELRDYTALKSITGAADLPFCDRDVIAEVLASRPRTKGPL